MCCMNNNCCGSRGFEARAQAQSSCGCAQATCRNINDIFETAEERLVSNLSSASNLIIECKYCNVNSSGVAPYQVRSSRNSCNCCCN